MSRILAGLIMTLGMVAVAPASAATQPPIAFGMDCMIHDAHGKMLSDLGTVGAMMNGKYMPVAYFNYGELTIEADLNGPFGETPEVAVPQLRLTVFNNKTVLAQLIESVHEDTNAALFVPTKNVYLHCDKMEM